MAYERQLTNIHMRCACSVACLFVIQQQDSVGLAVFDQKLPNSFPQRPGLAVARAFSRHLKMQSPGAKRSCGTNLPRLAQRLQRELCLISFSDCDKSPNQRCTCAFSSGASRGRSFQILDGDESNFRSPPESFESLEGIHVSHGGSGAIQDIDLKKACGFRSNLWPLVVDIVSIWCGHHGSALCARADGVSLAPFSNGHDFFECHTAGRIAA